MLEDRKFGIAWYVYFGNDKDNKLLHLKLMNNRLPGKEAIELILKKNIQDTRLLHDLYASIKLIRLVGSFKGKKFDIVMEFTGLGAQYAFKLVKGELPYELSFGSNLNLIYFTEFLKNSTKYEIMK